jgi:hypothetical protein
MHFGEESDLANEPVDLKRGRRDVISEITRFSLEIYQSMHNNATGQI